MLHPARTAAAACLALAALCACRSAGEETRTKAALAPPPTGALLYDGFENYSRPVTTTSPRAQRFVDQGLQWLFGFNDDEAIRCFREAARLDPDCAFAWWGVAYANGVNVNDPVMSEKESREAWEARGQALSRLDRASPVERALIEALAQRSVPFS